MRKDSIENKILSGKYPAKESFVEYYITQNHSQNNTAEHFNITRPIVQSLTDYWGLRKTKNQISEINSKTQKEGKRSVSLKIASGEYPSKEDFYLYYIEKGHSRKDTADYFGITETVVTTLSNYWNVHKNKSDISDTRKNTCLIRYGCSSNLQDEDTKQKIKETCLKKYGVEHISQSEEVVEKREQTFLRKYGVKHALQNDGIRQKLNSTMQEKYGVEWPCQLEQCQKAVLGKDSSPNLEFSKKLENQKIDFIREFPLENYLFDFKVGDKLIEIDPWFTHQSSFDIKFKKKDKKYHSEKSAVAAKYGYHCIHIFDWDDVDKVIGTFLKPKDVCYARKCEVKLVDVEEEADFLNTNHLQGYIKSEFCIGLYLDHELVQLMSFGKPRYNTNYTYELLRLCSSKTVIGGAEKIFKYFISNYEFNSVISYCDLSKFNGAVYHKMGFKLLRSAIGKHWYSAKMRKHITDNLLRQRGFDQLLGKTFGVFGRGTSNEELMLSHGFVEIYDAGQATYILQNNKKNKDAFEAPFVINKGEKELWQNIS